jgi:hypothetical protein
MHYDTGPVDRDITAEAGHHRAMTTIVTAPQAARICGVTIRTIQRHREGLEAAGAWKDHRGRWQIPVTALAAVGLRPGNADTVTATVRDMTHDSTTVSPTSVTDALALQAQLADLRRRAEVAEARAAGLQALVETQARALRQLEAAGERGSGGSSAQEPPQGGPLSRMLVRIGL